MNYILSKLIELLYTIPAVVIAISLHEAAHGLMSYKLGDPTPKKDGRLSLNPLKHFDPMGTLCLVFFHFGWAKPVMVNPRYYKNKKVGMVLVALAGPFMNFLIAFLSLFTIALISEITLINGPLIYLFVFLMYLAIINIGLGVFNLVPVPPLDGSKVLGAILPSDKYFKYMQYEQYGMIVLVLLLFAGILDKPFSLASGFLTTAMQNLSVLIINLI